MRPSRVTWVASTIIRPAPEYARWPRCTKCQSFMLPSSAQYWHIGEMTMRFGSVIPPSAIGVKSLGCGNGDSFFSEFLPEGFCKRNRLRLVAVQAKRIGGDGNSLAREAGDDALLHHRERLLHRFRLFLDHAARLVAGRQRAVVGVAPIGEDFA